ncbi:hypothetical protein LKL35_36755 [Streptomyces sp. ET3-23]|uniref:hypothetical protein n=1 Tax=Streptomyces sp. ET3-23 TaxID=2885643 RepID=UPI001D12449F|nr:hypothetical protein [Streptomyces sp. ET3-23]MCC2280877.1 hypothetical protein [Streptomyces sp. ET3-23]
MPAGTKENPSHSSRALGSPGRRWPAPPWSGLALVEQGGGQSDAVHDLHPLEPRLAQGEGVGEVAAGGPVAVPGLGEVAGGDSAGAGVLGGVEVRDPRRHAAQGGAY